MLLLNPFYITSTFFFDYLEKYSMNINSTPQKQLSEALLSALSKMYMAQTMISNLTQQKWHCYIGSSRIGANKER